MHRKNRGPALCIVRISTVSIKLEELYGPNPAGISYPPTSDIPLPLPFKTLDPWLGSRVLKGKGIGQHEDTLGLPLLITSHDREKLFKEGNCMQVKQIFNIEHWVLPWIYDQI